MPTAQLPPLTPAGMRRRRKIRRIFATAVLLVFLLAATAVAGRLWLRHAIAASLPQLDGKLRVSGLTAPVTIRRDALGIPHIQAASEDDLVFAQGYVTAQDRLWQMDMLRRHAAGELAEVLGSKLLDHDKTQRYLQLRAVADRSVATLAPAELHALEQYSKGVNAAIAADSPLPAEFRLLGYQPRPWTPRDSLLVGFAMAEDLSTGYPNKLNREVVQSHLAPELTADLYPTTTFRDHPPAEGKKDLSAPREMIQIPLDPSQIGFSSNRHIDDLKHASEVLAASVSALRCDGCAAGSNNWAVSGARSASGKPMVANDMHLQITEPGIWYTADLHAPGLDAAGVTLPGVPYIVVGHNAHVAWGFTNSGADVQDLYIEQRSGDSVRTPDGATQPLEHHREVIQVKHGLNTTVDVALTRHGNALTPVLSPLFPSEKRTLALRWSLYEPGYASVPFGAASKSSTGAELEAAFAHFGGPSQNLVWGDDAGHIGYHLVGLVPLRGNAGGYSLAAVPVATGALEWTGFIPYDQLPLTTDPASGVLATANARITPDSYPYPITLDWEAPYRNERIWRGIGDRTGLAPADMTALQNDTVSALDRTLGERVAYAVDHANKPSKRAREAADLLRSWDGRVTLNAPQPNITQAVRNALMPMLLEPRLGKAWALYTPHARSYALELLTEMRQPRWLPSGYADWDTLLTAALERGLKESGAPGRLADWHWSNTHTIDLRHPIFGSTWYLRWLSGDHTLSAALPGNAYTVRAAAGLHSASERFVVDLAAPQDSTLTLPLGESANRASPNFSDQFAAWVAGKPLPLTTASATHTLTLTP